MNPIFDPGAPGAPQFVPGTNPQLFSAQTASIGGGDPGTVGGGGSASGGEVPNQYANRVATHDTPSLQYAREHGGYSGGYTGAGLPSAGGSAATSSAATLPHRPAPTGGQPTHGWTNPNHQGAIGTNYSRYAMGGNIGNSAPGARGPTGAMPVDYPGDYPWMQDQNIQWGGGPFGYLPIGYQPQNWDYYSQNMPGGRLAPWEEKYFHDTFTQNYDPNQPGYVNTRSPNVGQTRG